MTAEIRVLEAGDEGLLADVAAGVFDHTVRTAFAAEFLADLRHHLAVAVDEGTVVGFASGVHYLHPDERPKLWINVIGVGPGYRRLGLGRRLMEAVFARGRQLGCCEAWVLNEPTDAQARSFYAALDGTERPAVMFSCRLT